jgi:membrane dipeptidase
VNLNRRHILGAAASLAVSPRGLSAADQRPIYIADMHVHLFFVGPKPAQTQPLAVNMARGKATLVGDQPWLKAAPGGFAPNGKPAKGQALAWLRDEAARAKAHLSEQGLPLVRTAADVAKSLEGKPQVVLSVEGATFADIDVEQLKTAHDLGVRHLQLVHFLENAIGDIQTAAPAHGGLTAHGRSIVEACNRLGILIDLAHCTERVVDQVLEVSTAPVVWSHSSVSGWKVFWPFGQASFVRRQLSSAAHE